MTPSEFPKLDPERLFHWHSAYGSRLRAFVYGLVRNHALAEEVVQATFMKGLLRAAEIPPESEKAWLFQVACNEALQLKRKQKVEQAALQIRSEFQQKAVHTDISPDWRSLRREVIESVRIALAQLPADERVIVQERIYGGKTFQEIADELQLPIGTVLTRMRRATQSLQKILRTFEDPIS